MNREAVALGTPVYTTFSGRLGAVDADLVARGRLRILERAEDLPVERRTPAGRPTTRDPAQLLDAMFGVARAAR
jgi:predicted glycosyltransferase